MGLKLKEMELRCKFQEQIYLINYRSNITQALHMFF